MDHSSHNMDDHSGHDMTADDHSGMMHDSNYNDSTMMEDPTGMTDMSGHVGHMMSDGGGDSSDAFCNANMGMVMFMDGFRWALKGGGSCLNLYFPGWTLDSRGKIIASMIGVLVLAILTEAISKYRHRLSQRAKKTYFQSPEAKTLRLTQTSLHGLHALTGYVLMLATMTFSLELMLCVIIGLVIGYAIFGGDQYSHVTTNPCCAFLEDEACERTPSSSNGSNNGDAVAAAAAAAAPQGDDEETAGGGLKGNLKDDGPEMTELNVSNASEEEEADGTTTEDC